MMNLQILYSMIGQTCGRYYSIPRSFKYVGSGLESERLHCIFFRNRTATLFHIEESGNLAPAIPNIIDANRKLSKEEILLKQRKRELIQGVTDYDTLSTQDNNYLTFSSGPRVFMLDNSTSKVKDVTGKSQKGVVKMDVKFGFDGKFYCFTSNDDLYLQDIENLDKTVRLTQDSETKHVSGGVADFIHQEEFDRTSGYWISDEKINGHYVVSYLRVDSREVNVIKIPKGGYDTGFDEYYYPRAGETNSTSVLVTLHLDENFNIVQRKEHVDLFTKGNFSWTEYIVNSGWIGGRVWIQLLDRRQKQYAFVLFDPITEKTEQIWGEGRPESYVNVSNKVFFLSPDEVVLGSESSGFHHLYLHKRVGDGKWERTNPITIGKNWAVYFKDKMWVDKVNRRVYYLANKDCENRSNLYCSDIDNPKKMKLLCRANYFYDSVCFNSNFTQFVTTYSNSRNSHQIGIFQLSNPSEKDINNLKYELLLKIPYMNPAYTFSERDVQSGSSKVEEEDGETSDSSSDSGDEAINGTPHGYALKVPKMFRFKSSKGNYCRGCYFLPDNYEEEVRKDPNKKYPAILYVYGGPHVQLVKDWFRLSIDIRAQFFASLGFIYVVIDGEGSRNRGLEFESVVYKKMGQVELQTQMDGLLHLMTRDERKISIDPQRIGIYGFSYGGYLSLMAMCKHSDFFKVGISGAPVTDWKLYDTAYTERYMDIPKKNVKGYKDGNVMEFIRGFPEEPNRVLLVHGLADENVMFVNSEVFLSAVIEARKQIDFLAYPFQRHMFSSSNARQHRHFLISNFFLRNL